MNITKVEQLNECCPQNDIDEMQNYIDEMVKQGYMLEDGTPLKCSCGCTDLEQTDEYYEEHWLVEYAVKCKLCGKKLGHWAYGSWNL